MRKIFLSIIIALFAVLCFTKAPEVSAQAQQYSCVAGVDWTYNESKAAVVVSVDSSKLDPNETYYGIIGSGQMFDSTIGAFPLAPSGEVHVGGTEYFLPPEDDVQYSDIVNLTVVVAASKGYCGGMQAGLALDARKGANMINCRAYGGTSGGCVVPIQINRTDERKFDPTPDVYEIAESAKDRMGKIFVPPYSLCQQIPIANSGTGESGVAARAKKQEDARNACCKCATGNTSAVFDPALGNCSYPGSDAVAEITSPNLYTAVGCIPTSPENIIRSVVRIGLGIAGGVALLMILAGAFMYTTSQGEPKRTGEARDMITSAVMGLLFIIFSVVILRFIGVSILQIPGFG